MFTVTIWDWIGATDEELPDRPAEADEYLVSHIFTRGQCHAYALAVHELTGWPIIGSGWCCSCCGDAEPCEGESWVPNHCGNLTPEGEVYDVTSFYGPSDTWDDWDRDEVVEPELVLGNFHTDAYLTPAMEVARVYAKHALASEGLI